MFNPRVPISVYDAQNPMNVRIMLLGQHCRTLHWRIAHKNASTRMLLLCCVRCMTYIVILLRYCNEYQCHGHWYSPLLPATKCGSMGSWWKYYWERRSILLQQKSAHSNRNVAHSFQNTQWEKEGRKAEWENFSQIVIMGSVLSGAHRGAEGDDCPLFQKWKKYVTL